MANTVKLKRSAVQGKAPVVGDLSLGELAVNTYDGKLYMKKNDGSDAIVEIGAGASVTTSDTAPSSPADGDLWYRSSDGRLYVYYDDGNSQQWVDANPNLPPDPDTFQRSGTTVSLVNSGDTVSLDGDLTVDTFTLHADSTNNRVGVGTNSPATLLHAFGGYPTVKVENNNTTQFASASIELQGPAGDERITKLLHGNSNTGGTETYFKIEQYDSNGTFVKTLCNYDYQFDFWSFNTAGSERMRIDSSGNVGIGTDSPGSKLEISGNVNTALRIRDTTGAYSQITYNDNGSSTSALTIEVDPGNTSTPDSDIRFKVDGSEKMRIAADGSVGIGTSSSTATLHVQNNDNTPGGNIQTWTADLGTNTRSATLIAPEVDDINDPFIFHTNNAWQFRVDSTDALTIDSSGDVGIGTDSPTEKLTVDGNILLASTSQYVKFAAGNSQESGLLAHDSDANERAGINFQGVGSNQTTAITFSTSDTVSSMAERMRIDNNGKVLINTSTSRENLVNGSLSAQLQVEGTGHSVSSGSFIRNGDNRFASFLTLGKTRGTANGSNTIVQNDDLLGTFAFLGADGTNLIPAAKIVAEVDGTPGTNDMPGRLVFSTTSDGASDATERMRIDSSGNVGIGTSSPDSTLHLTKTDATAYDATATDGQVGIGPTLYLENPANANNTVGGQIVFGMRSTEEQARIAATGGTAPSLTFGTADNERMRIASSGFVGIGTTLPTRLLELAGSGGATNVELRLNATDGGERQITFTGSGSNTHTIKSTGTTDNSLVFVQGPDERMRINSSGNVGIGTSSPGAPLHLIGTARIEDTGTIAISLKDNGSSNFYGFIGRGTDEALYINGGGTTPELSLRTGGTERMRIDSSGNVGIGTSTPGAKLDVNGSLSKNSGSFKIDHPLPALTETHHLVHSFVEAPDASNLYAGMVDLVDGTATVNIDTAHRMSEGTFEALNTLQSWSSSNESGYAPVKCSVSGNILTIECQDPTSTDTVYYEVRGIRKDQHMLDTEWTDSNGIVITEPLKSVSPQE